MAKTADALSLNELKALLGLRERELQALKRERESIRERLAKVEAKISALKGRRTKRTVRRRRPPRNAEPLRVVVHTVLAGATGPLALDDIVAAVLAAGYRSRSRNFRNVVYQCLYANDEFVSGGERGTYTLAKPRRTKRAAKKKAGKSTSESTAERDPASILPEPTSTDGGAKADG